LYHQSGLEVPAEAQLPSASEFLSQLRAIDAALLAKASNAITMLQEALLLEAKGTLLLCQGQAEAAQECFSQALKTKHVHFVANGSETKEELVSLIWRLHIGRASCLWASSLQKAAGDIHQALESRIFGHEVGALLGPTSATPLATIIFLHGLQQSAVDNLFIGKALHAIPDLKDVQIIFPEAPHTVPPPGRGRSWFGLLPLNPTQPDSLDMIVSAVGSLLALVDTAEAPVVLIGYSQGALAAILAALAMDQQPLGLVCLNGGASPELLALGKVLQPNYLNASSQAPSSEMRFGRGIPTQVLQSQDDLDVTTSSASALADGLRNLGLDVQTKLYTGFGHALSPDQILRLAMFVRHLVATRIKSVGRQGVEGQEVKPKAADAAHTSITEGTGDGFFDYDALDGMNA